MWLSFYRGRRRPGHFKKESFFRAQPFFLAAEAAKIHLKHSGKNWGIFPLFLKVKENATNIANKNEKRNKMYFK